MMIEDSNVENIVVDDWLVEYKNTTDEKIKKKLKKVSARVMPV